MIRRYLMPIGIALAIVITDLITKRYAALNFVDADVVVIPGFLRFTFVENPGAAFSLFKNGGQIVGVVAILVSIGLLWLLRVERPTGERAALGLILGGAIGNLTDRFARGDGILDGPVIDWVNMWWIPTFNVADSAVTIAVVLLSLFSWKTSRTSESS